MCDTAKRILIF